MSEMEGANRVWRSLHSRIRESKNRDQLHGGSNVKRRYQYRSELKKVESRVKQLAADLAQMEEAPLEFSISSGELARRRGMLTRLRTETNRIGAMLERNRGLVRGGAAGDDMEEGLADGMEDEAFESRGLSNEQLIELQRDEEGKQSEHLDEILRGVTTLRGMSKNIGNELSAQDGILTNLDDGVGKTDRNILRNIHSVEAVSMSSASCWPMFTIIFLFFVIVFLLAI